MTDSSPLAQNTALVLDGDSDVDVDVDVDVGVDVGNSTGLSCTSVYPFVGESMNWINERRFSIEHLEKNSGCIANNVCKVYERSNHGRNFFF